MALVHRNGRTYLYRSVRQDGRVTSEYVGSGQAFALIGQLEAERREEDRAERDAWKAERERMDSEERAAVEWFDRVQRLADSVMVAAGYHQHKRQWRKRRGPNQHPRQGRSG